MSGSQSSLPRQSISGFSLGSVELGFAEDKKSVSLGKRRALGFVYFILPFHLVHYVFHYLVGNILYMSTAFEGVNPIDEAHLCEGARRDSALLKCVSPISIIIIIID